MGAVMVATPVQELKAVTTAIQRRHRRERTDDGVRWRPSINVTLRKID